MKVIQINTVFKKGSTGKIAYQIQQESYKNDILNIVAYRYAEENQNEENTYCISTWLDCHIHNRIARYTKKIGAYSKVRTRKFIKYLKEQKPDIVHIHNIHGAYINISVLFSYLKKSRIKTVWTLHDCWAFTGNCPHFDMVKCSEWKNDCIGCKQYVSVFGGEQSAYNLKLKKQLYGDMENLTLVTPSKWLADKVKQSFIGRHPSVIIYNGIDLNVFKPTASDFRETHGIGEKFLILGVAFDWGPKKGLDVFIELANRLDPEKYQIVLVGTNDAIDNQLPKSILSVHRTHSQIELAKIYTAADLFVNPTREEMFGLVNVEALACGTPGVTFNTGGSPECYDAACGSVVECDDITGLEKEIIRICRDKPYTKDNCVKRAKMFDMNDRFREYIELYKSI